MRITRSATRAAVNSANTSTSNPQKRKLNTAADQAAPKIKKRKAISNTSVSTSAAGPQVSTNVDLNATSNASTLSEEEPGLVPAILTFSFEDAKQHLINVDHRFEDLFTKMACRPFQHLETVHPFR